jgi:hypothetical protein
MIYIFAISGFIGGFIFGQMVIFFLLRHRSRDDLLNDKSIKWTYGTLNWIIALIGAYSFVLMHNIYFGP